MRNYILDLIARVNFWYATRNFASEKDYKFFLDLNDENSFCIEILRKYPRTVIEFKNVQMGEGQYLHFDFDVIANPELHDINSKKFKKFVSYIMMAIIADSVKYSKGIVNENRASDPFESLEERDILEESDPISEVRVSKRKPRKKVVRGNKNIRSKV